MIKKNDKLEAILKVIKRNDIIDKLYKRLTELEINGLKDSDDYRLIIDFIRDIDSENDNFFKKASYYDDETNEIIDNIIGMNKFSDNYIEYIGECKNTKLKRFLCQYEQCALIRDDFPNEMLMQENSFININGMQLPAEEAIDVVECMDENSANFIREFLNEVKEKTYEIYSTYNYLLYCRNALQHHTAADYLEESIKNERNKKIKNKLIEYKYMMISIYKYLEAPFLKNPNNYSRTAFYQDILKDYYEDNIEFFVDWDQYYQEQVNDVLANIMDKTNTKYTNLKERYHDKLLSIYLKVFSSISSSEKTFIHIDNGKRIALEMAKNKLSQNVIKNSLDLDQDLLLSKKLVQK